MPEALTRKLVTFYASGMDTVPPLTDADMNLFKPTLKRINDINDLPSLHQIRELLK